ncbi:2-succinyl-5-enolpyruvyl-6-hydroxy-3-cyclohexene-1-carboxylic-acid synthase [Magnetovibrio blakemorei]|uniref:2-succinyl-5-enolpyruvyl-6-hydroxy-3-cyclohexene-1-carboxylate synthase n=2 Tax=Magnetovibrio blakemorei TaxID=28181 RepID=A0A1E5QC98_9PROT|nr:2-succinyl-5-enolpyruvyl-6-hydroxy-3-cyclohexene-1-carboxylic-acid synthase [Magnetovibrio blakemorei]
MLDQGHLNLIWADALINGLVQAGVRRVVISPGSRSTPLVLAVARHPSTRDWVIGDERSAAYFALGLSKLSGTPAAVICTSGTAVANWLPAIMEASAANVPLILISADRPPEARAIGANQTTDQIKLFGDLVRAFHELPPPAEDEIDTLPGLTARIVDAALSSRPGPVHINVPFREPLLPKNDLPPANRRGGRAITIHRGVTLPSADTITTLAAVLSSGKGVIVCGPDRLDVPFAHAAVRLANRVNAPILADPLSGLRRGPWVDDTVIGGYDGFLRSPHFTEAHQPDWVLRFGAYPVSKGLGQYMRMCATSQHIVVAEYDQWPDPAGHATHMIHADPRRVAESLTKAIATGADLHWLKAFQAADAQVRAALPPPSATGLFEDRVVTLLAHHLPADSLLFAGNSMPVRELDSFLSVEHKPLRMTGNRGVSGIDGNIATLLGLAAADPAGAPAVGLIGDLTFAHDSASLRAAQDIPVLIVVLDNGGGGIFEYLPQAGLDAALFARYWLTDDAPDIAKVCAAYEIVCHHAIDEASLQHALSAALRSKTTQVIRVVLDRRASNKRHQDHWQACIDPFQGDTP